MKLGQAVRSTNVPLTSVTPLYGLVSEADVIVISDGVTITRISEERLEILSADDVFIDHIRLYQPQHLLWKTIELSSDQVTSIVEFSRTLETDLWRGGAENIPAVLAYVEPVSQLLRAFQLFKPGRFVAGDTSFFVRSQETDCKTLSLARCSEMSIDYQFVEQFAPHYVFNAAEVPFLLSFVQRLNAAWPRIQEFPQIDLALHRYSGESAQYGGVIELMISLEAVLVPETEGIAFRLSQRVANLLGRDAPSRNELFKQIKDFYGLRSKIVHGAKFRLKEITAAQLVDDLREITRRVLLSIMALAADADLDSAFYESLDGMCLDDNLRSSFQTKASVLLHC